MGWILPDKLGMKESCVSVPYPSHLKEIQNVSRNIFFLPLVPRTGLFL